MKFSKFNLILKNEHESNTHLLLNTLTGETFKIDSGRKEIIETKSIESLSKHDIEMYKNTGVLIEDGFDEHRYYSYIYNRDKFNSKVLSLTILLTNACNLRCVYCFQGAGEKDSSSLNNTTRENIFKFIKNQVEQRDTNIVSIVLFGGEPLLNFKSNIEWLDNIKKYCEDNGKVLVTSMVTNGTLVTDEVLDQLSKYNCGYIQITLDGVKEIHDERRIGKNGKGSFDEVIKGIKTIQKREDFKNPTIRVNIDKTNISKTEELLKYLAGENLTDCGIDFGIVKGGTEACAAYSGHCFMDDEVGEVLESMWYKSLEYGFSMSIQPSSKSIFCGLYGDSSFTIAPNGDVYKCWEHVGEEKHLMGKIDENGNISNVTFAYYDWMSRNPLETKDCRECSYLPACGGGCGSVSYERYGSYHAKGCFKVKGILEKQVNFKFKEVLKNYNLEKSTDC